MGKLTASYNNLYHLLDLAIAKFKGEDDEIRDVEAIEGIVNVLNGPPYKENKLKQVLFKSTMYKSYFLESKKEIRESNGETGKVIVVTEYPNRLCKYVFDKTFEEKYGIFKGDLLNISDGLEKIPKVFKKNNDPFYNDLKTLGITGTVNKLSSSRFQPSQCMQETQYSLSFCGILGSKWIKDLDRFEKFLMRVGSKPNGKVRFLIVDPSTKNFEKLRTLRGEHIKDESTSVFNQLCAKYDFLEVRCYDSLPNFRMIFMDNHILSISRYKLDKHNYIKSKQGWEAPHLVIESRSSDWSLYEPFNYYYNDMWERAKTIQKFYDEK